MLVAFRTDASVDQGTGHLMRCLVLANELRDRGHNCVFMTQPFLPPLVSQIRNEGHKVILINPGLHQNLVYQNKNLYLTWLGRSLDNDAFETYSKILEITPDVLVVDHYAIDYEWMKYFSELGVRKVVIDDLANRNHLCDILIDQNYGRSVEDYKYFVPSKTTILAGSEYVFIKDDFREIRSSALHERTLRKANRINICMGGMDKDNSTQDVLEVLQNITWLKNWNVDIILRSSSPHARGIKAFSEKMLLQTTVHFDSENVADLFSLADLAIGAGGVTLWERCCVGLPSLLLTIADNQFSAAQAMSQTEAIKYVGDIRQSNWTNKLSSSLEKLGNEPDTLKRMSQSASAICDGLGLKKVCDRIEDFNV
jgi:UDP-2,4-diacetamido-2,4,6-trideoxy-beta-L-altropyranose hydrolase